jgi:hypothetical protein
MESDVGRSPASRDTSTTAPARGTTSATNTTTASSCDTIASWGSRNDLAFESAPGSSFADSVNALIRASDEPAIAASSHMDANCVWMVAFSAPENASATGARHATTFAAMLRHPAGFWTAAPQAIGWLRVVDRAGRAVWIPIVDATGSATYGEASCASLSAVRVSAFIPASAADLSLSTAEGERTLQQLMGSEPSQRGWAVRFAFSADRECGERRSRPRTSSLSLRGLCPAPPEQGTSLRFVGLRGLRPVPGLRPLRHRNGAPPPPCSTVPPARNGSSKSWRSLVQCSMGQCPTGASPEQGPSPTVPAARSVLPCGSPVGSGSATGDAVHQRSKEVPSVASSRRSLLFFGTERTQCPKG